MEELTFEDLIGQDSAQDEDLEAGTKLATHNLFERLQASFPPPAYIALEEVRDATGYDGHRTADAIVVSLYRSRGKAIWGFEMKVSRNDWLKELKQPEKAESIMRYCDHWALVVPDKDIVKPGELPSTWGMYVAQKSRLKCVVPCPKLEPLPMSLTMLTALLYNVKHSHQMLDKAERDAEYSRGVEHGKSTIHQQDYEKDYNELREKVEKYEKASGLTIHYGWTSPEKVGAIVKLLLDGDANIKRVLHYAQYAVTRAENLKQSLEKQVEILQKVMDRVPLSEKDEEDL